MQPNTTDPRELLREIPHEDVESLGPHNVRHNAQITVNAITGSFRGLPQEWVEYMEAEKVAADGGLRSKFGFLLRQGGFGWRWRMRWFELRGSVLTCKREQLSPDADGSTHEYFLGGATISTSRGDDEQQQGAGAGADAGATSVPRRFRLTLADKTVLTLLAQTPRESTAWIEALHGAIRACDNKDISCKLYVTLCKARGLVGAGRASRPGGAAGAHGRVAAGAWRLGRHAPARADEDPAAARQGWGGGGSQHGTEVMDR